MRPVIMTNEIRSRLVSVLVIWTLSLGHFSPIHRLNFCQTTLIHRIVGVFCHYSRRVRRRPSDVGTRKIYFCLLALAIRPARIGASACFFVIHNFFSTYRPNVAIRRPPSGFRSYQLIAFFYLLWVWFPARSFDWFCAPCILAADLRTRSSF